MSRFITSDFVTTDTAAKKVGQIYAADSFNRADGAPGNTEVGGLPWALENASGAMAIASNKMALTGVNAQSAGAYIIDANLDGELSMTHSGSANDGLFWRSSSVSNGYVCYRDASTYVIKRRTGTGSFTAMGTTSGISPAAGDKLRVVVQGDSHKLYVNGALALSLTDATHLTQTRKGLFVYSTGAHTFDDFQWTSLTG